jgi:hypothetical protein
MSKNALWAMLQGQITPETAALAKKAAMVTAVTDDKLGKVTVSESAVSYGSLSPDPYGRTSDKRIVVETPSVNRFDVGYNGVSAPAPYQQTHVPQQPVQQMQPQGYQQDFKVKATPDKIMTMISGDKTAIKEMKKQLHGQPQQQYSPSPVVDAINEAMGYVVPAQTYQPQMLNEAEIRMSVKQIIKEELDNILLQNIFSENRMMQLYQEQLKKTLTRILEQKAAKKAVNKTQ